MKLENQVCTKEQAERLKAFGIAQISLYYIHPNFIGPVDGNIITTAYGKQYKKTLVRNDKKYTCSAFTVAELGVMLPSGYDTMHATNDGWRCYDLDGVKMCKIPFKTEADVRGDAIIRLLESGRLTAAEVNERLLNS